MVYIVVVIDLLTRFFHIPICLSTLTTFSSFSSSSSADYVEGRPDESVYHRRL